MMVDFYYEDMAVFAVDGNGNLDWSEVLHKNNIHTMMMVYFLPSSFSKSLPPKTGV